jgi:cell wall-associated NlpC family hydrolase
MNEIVPTYSMSLAYSPLAITPPAENNNTNDVSGEPLQSTTTTTNNNNTTPADSWKAVGSPARRASINPIDDSKKPQIPVAVDINPSKLPPGFDEKGYSIWSTTPPSISPAISPAVSFIALITI